MIFESAQTDNFIKHSCTSTKQESSDPSPTNFDLYTKIHDIEKWVGKTVDEFSLQAQTLHSFLMIWHKSKVKTEGKSCSRNSFSDDYSKIQCKELNETYFSKQFFLMTMHKIQARQEGKSLAKLKLNLWTKCILI